MDEIPLWRVRVKSGDLVLAYIVEAHDMKAARGKTEAFIKERPHLKGFEFVTVSHEFSRDIGIDIK